MPDLCRRGLSGLISPKWVVKSRLDSRTFSELLAIILGGPKGCFVWPLPSGCLMSFAAKRKIIVETLFMAQPSLFFPHFDFTLMNVYMNTEIK